MKGIILAGGAGTRLYPLTIVRTINRSMFMDRPSLRESWLLAPHWTSISLFVSLGYSD